MDRLARIVIKVLVGVVLIPVIYVFLFAFLYDNGNMTGGQNLVIKFYTPLFWAMNQSNAFADFIGWWWVLINMS